MNLILLPPGTVAGPVMVTGDPARHLRTVLRVTAGDTVRIGVEDGPVGIGTVTHLAAEGDAVALQCHFDPTVPERPQVDLLLAVPRPKVLRRLWAQLAALGVGRIILTNAAKVERPYFDTHILEPEVYSPLLVEGLRQARDTRVPLVTVHRQFRKLIEDELDALSDAPVRLLADPGAHPAPSAALARHPPSRVLLAVGPEGGWNDFERGLLGAQGFTSISMGDRTLRTDTACVALITLVHAALDRPVP